MNLAYFYIISLYIYSLIIHTFTNPFCHDRLGPYGLVEKPEHAYYKAYDIDPKTLADEIKPDKPKKTKIPFSDPLSMRTTYDNKIPQPPVRQIYFRKRRSKRRVRMEMSSHGGANNLGNSGRKLLSHQSSCCCDTCAAGGLQELCKMEQKTKGLFVKIYSNPSHHHY